MSQVEYIQPVNIEAEQAVLGSMMIEQKALTQGLALLKVTDFYRPTHQEIFAAIQELEKHGQPCELHTLTEIMKQRNSLLECGGVEYLMICVDRVPTAANIEYYARIVKRYAALRKQISIGMTLPNMAKKPDADPREISGWLSTQLDELNSDSVSGLMHVSELLGSHLRRIEDGKDKIGIDGYTTGFSHLDSVTGGYGAGIFVLLKAKSEQGKTHHLIQASVNCLRAGLGVALFSLDTPQWILLNRIIAHLTGINSFKVRRPSDKELERIIEAQGWLYQQPLYLWDEADVPISRMKSMCRSLQASGVKLGLVGIDYAELVAPENASTNREQEVSSIAKGVKNMRDSLDTTIMLLSQVNEQGQERWSRSIGHACDISISWTIDDEGGARLTTHKNRLGRGTSFPCVYDWGTSRIREESLDYSDPAYPPSWPWWYNSEADDFAENPNPFSAPGSRDNR